MITPGKWEADTEGEYVFTRVPEGLMMVAQMRGRSYLTGELNLSSEEAIEVQKANARLMAEAPEMCEILRGIAYGSCEECMPQMVKAREILARIDE